MIAHHFQFKQFTVHYRVGGKGIPLLLIHGFGEDATVWDGMIDELKKNAFVIVIDLPGSGKSIVETSHLTEGNIELLNSIEFYAEVIHALLQQLQIVQCIVLGHSMGGYIALAFAEKYADFLKGFGLIHSTAYPDSDEKKKNRKRGIDLMESYSGYDFLKTSIPNLFTDEYKKKHPENVNNLIEDARNFKTKVLQCYYAAMMQRPDRSLVLKESKVPVLLVAGEKDVVVPLKDLLHQAHLPNVCQFHILKEAAHMGMWETTKELTDQIISFTESL